MLVAELVGDLILILTGVLSYSTRLLLMKIHACG